MEHKSGEGASGKGASGNSQRSLDWWSEAVAFFSGAGVTGIVTWGVGALTGSLLAMGVGGVCFAMVRQMNNAEHRRRVGQDPATLPVITFGSTFTPQHHDLAQNNPRNDRGSQPLGTSSQVNQQPSNSPPSPQTQSGNHDQSGVRHR